VSDLIRRYIIRIKANGRYVLNNISPYDAQAEVGTDDPDDAQIVMFHGRSLWKRTVEQSPDVYELIPIRIVPTR
jgi:hypothetical protein